MVLIWSSSKLKKHVRKIVDTRIKKVYGLIKKKLAKETADTLRDEIRLEVKRQLSGSAKPVFERTIDMFKDHNKRLSYLEDRMGMVLDHLRNQSTPEPQAIEIAPGILVSEIVLEITETLEKHSVKIKFIEENLQLLVEFLESEKEAEQVEPPPPSNGMMNLGEMSKIMAAGGPQKEKLLRTVANSRGRGEFHGAGLGGLHGSTMKGGWFNQ